MTPTMHLRFVEREQIISSDPEARVSTSRTIKVLQQFWETPNGKDAVGDMFVQLYGVWRDIPLVRD